ncbi:MAG: SUF system NifU family Fe-S cluster assembly protein [Dehalococcoidia bacterium]|nr:SUF system NifU family Fe-S cluster assembly protein [Dehalococcoidia bacterium]
MSEIRELYQEVVMDHTRHPRNFHKLEGANKTADGYNPFCGDRVSIFLKLKGDRVEDVGFQGAGCAISTSSASMLTEAVKGKTTAEIQALYDVVHQMLTRAPGTEFDDEKLGDLEILSGVSEFPTRVKCAGLSWHTLMAALKGDKEAIFTE